MRKRQAAASVLAFRHMMKWKAPSAIREDIMIKQFVKIILAVMCLMTFLAACSEDKYKNEVRRNRNNRDSLIQIIANPSDYQSKRVVVVGYINLSFEATAIYLHEEDANRLIFENAFWLNLPQSEKDKYSKYNGSYCAVDGIFDDKNHGFMGMYSGAINVKNIFPYLPEAVE
ncbi:MAG: hypothetical protein EOM12_12100 [Verrucomicrobiae bacterium]|nr:hypothetical protein [Verrucomicrobiae bacterium]